MRAASPCFICGKEDFDWLSDGFDCPFTDLCEECWSEDET